MPEIKKGKPLAADELSLFFQQFYILFQAGIKPADAIGVLQADANSPREKALLAQLAAGLEKGRPLSGELAKSGVFPAYSLQMLQVGEETGRMEQVLGALSEHYRQEAELSDSLRRMVGYPVILAVIIAAVVFVLVTQVLPVFQRMLEQLGSGGPLLGLGHGFQIAAVVLAVLLLALALVVFGMAQSHNGQSRLKKAADGTFLSGKLSRAIAKHRFASALNLRLASGEDLLAAVEKSRALVGDDALSAQIETCAKDMAGGVSFPLAAERAGLFTGMEAGLLSAGFRSGATEAVTARLAQRANDQTQELLDRLLGRVEPLLVVFLALAVGLVLLSVMLPLLSMMTSIGA